MNRRDSWKRVINGRMSSQVWLGQVDDDDTTSASRCSEQKDSDGEEEDDGDEDSDSDEDSSGGDDCGNEASTKVVIQNIFIPLIRFLLEYIYMRWCTTATTTTTTITTITTTTAATNTTTTITTSITTTVTTTTATTTTTTTAATTTTTTSATNNNATTTTTLDIHLKLVTIVILTSFSFLHIYLLA